MEKNMKKKNNTMKYHLIPVEWLSSNILQITNIVKYVKKM